jgi:5S rRNA maturation endonuclease (ribonuclease M5)
LVDKGFIQQKPNAGSWAFTLCSPTTGLPLPAPGSDEWNNPVDFLNEPAPTRALVAARPQTRPSVAGSQKFTEAQIQQYYKHRLSTENFSSESPSGWLMVRCPFHSDRTPSLAINTVTGGWICHGCKLRGNIFEFEKHFLKCDFETAQRNVESILGVRLRHSRLDEQVVATYDYWDYDGALLYQCVRYTPKRFSYRHLNREGRLVSGIGVSAEDCILYNLPALRAASTVVVCEGEKDSDSVASLGLLAAGGTSIATTTNPFGALKWKDKYSRDLSGKRIVVLPDNDELGVEHAHQVRESLEGLAADVRLIHLYSAGALDSEHPDHKNDVSDFLEEHNASDLLQTINSQIGAEWLLVERAVSQTNAA